VCQHHPREWNIAISKIESLLSRNVNGVGRIDRRDEWVGGWGRASWMSRWMDKE
jgi:hypothetical protein